MKFLKCFISPPKSKKIKVDKKELSLLKKSLNFSISDINAWIYTLEEMIPEDATIDITIHEKKVLNKAEAVARTNTAINRLRETRDLLKRILESSER